MMNTMKANSIEINDPAIEISGLMKKILADEFVLYTKARNYHWNLTGPNFFGLHDAFEKLYDGLADDIDVIAERIRALGLNAPGTLNEFTALSSLNEEPGYYPQDIEMVQNVINDLQTVTGKIISAAGKMQNEYSDEVSAGIFYGIAEKYQKTTWMLKSLLNK